MPDSFEIFMNEQRAELAFFKITMTVLMLRLINATPALAEERLQDLKSTVMGAVGRIPVESNEPGSDRMKQMTSMRGDRFFADLEALLLQARTTTGQAGRN